MRNDDAGGRATRLKRVGLNDEVGALCANEAVPPKALASGSFIAPGADEVLLQVPSGLAAAGGDATLAILREEGSGYRLVRHLLASSRFEAHARLEVRGGADLLFLCQHSGKMGLYTATCGFLGRGSFRDSGRAEIPDRPGSGTRDEIQLVLSIACGPGAAVRIGAVSGHDERLLVELIAEEYRREREGPGDVSTCGKVLDRATERFSIEYALDATRPRRLTPIPQRVRGILACY